MTPNKPIDFTKVEALRRHMLLTIGDMATILGVSRTAYYKWLNGGALRKNKEADVRVKLRHLLAIMTDHGWPTPEIIGMEPALRLPRLVALLREYE